MHIDLSVVADYFIFLSPSAMWLVGVFTERVVIYMSSMWLCPVNRKTSWRGCSCSSYFYSNTHITTKTQDLTFTCCRFNSISLTVSSLGKWNMIPAFLLPHIYSMKAERALEALSLVKYVCQSQGQRWLPVSLLMFWGLITADAA